MTTLDESAEKKVTKNHVIATKFVQLDSIVCVYRASIPIVPHLFSMWKSDYLFTEQSENYPTQFFF